MEYNIDNMQFSIIQCLKFLCGGDRCYAYKIDLVVLLSSNKAYMIARRAIMKRYLTNHDKIMFDMQ